MGKNKSQQAAEERATKKTTPAPAAEQPKPVAATPTQAAAKLATPAQPSKQDATLAKLKAGWEAKGVDLSKMTVKDDGKFKNVIVGEGWPSYLFLYFLQQSRSIHGQKIITN